MLTNPATQFHFYLPWGQQPFSIVSSVFANLRIDVFQALLSTHLIVVHTDVLLPVGAITPAVPAQAGEQLLEAGHDVVACTMGILKIFKE